LSRRSREELIAAGVEAIRGWQTDQDIFDDAAATYGRLNRTDTRVIDIVQRAGRMSAGEIATAARLTSGAVTAVIDRLEAAGFACRVRDTEDRRRVLVEVTPALDELMRPVFGPLAEEGYGAMAEYDDDRLEVIVEFMERARASLVHHTARVFELIAERDAAPD
jgi:DNA-binding MarR family transcriptional regulator